MDTPYTPIGRGFPDILDEFNEMESPETRKITMNP
jgi:hypothetical protein